MVVLQLTCFTWSLANLTLSLPALPFLAKRQDTIQDSFQFGRGLVRERGLQVRTVDEVSAVLEGLGEHVKTTLDNPISTHVSCDLCAPLLVILPLLFIPNMLPVPEEALPPPTPRPTAAPALLATYTIRPRPPTPPAFHRPHRNMTGLTPDQPLWQDDLHSWTVVEETKGPWVDVEEELDEVVWSAPDPMLQSSEANLPGYGLPQGSSDQGSRVSQPSKDRHKTLRTTAGPQLPPADYRSQEEPAQQEIYRLPSRPPVTKGSSIPETTRVTQMVPPFRDYEAPLDYHEDPGIKLPQVSSKPIGPQQPHLARAPIGAGPSRPSSQTGPEPGRVTLESLYEQEYPDEQFISFDSDQWIDVENSSDRYRAQSGRRRDREAALEALSALERRQGQASVRPSRGSPSKRLLGLLKEQISTKSQRRPLSHNYYSQ